MGDLDDSPRRWEVLMRALIVEARSATAHRDVPVAAAVVDSSGRLLAVRHNEKEKLSDPTAHAELLAIRDAARVLGSWHLEGTSLVCTLEPCNMCAGAVISARMDLVVFGAPDPKAGACGSLYNLCADPRLNHEPEVVRGVLAQECGTLLEEFFRTLRP